MPRSDIADYLALTIETVSRSLADLKKSGVIAVPNVHEIAILDPARLEALAQGLLSHCASALPTARSTADARREISSSSSARYAMYCDEMIAAGI
jgi:hypothetical protein